MPPKNKKNAPPTTPRRGMHKPSSKPQLPPEFQSNEELTRMDESSTMMEFRLMLGTLTTALVTMAMRMDQLSHDKASKVDITSAQPGTSAGGNPLSSLHRRLSCQPSTGQGLGTTPQPPSHRWPLCQSSLGPWLGAPPLPVPPATWIWSKTSRIWSSTE